MAGTDQFVTFGAAGEIFAAPVRIVSEILQTRPIARLPQAAVGLLGVVDVRGQTVPVVDLRVTLGLPAATDTESTRIIVLRLELAGRELTIGLRTDRVFEVTVLDADDLEPPPNIGGRRASPAISGIGRRNGAFVTVLDLERVLSAADLAEIGMSDFVAAA